MTIEETPTGAILITGEDIPTYVLLSFIHAAALEINTGMSMARMPLNTAARNIKLIPDDGKRPTKRTLLRLAIEKMQTIDPGYEPSASVAKAVAK